jgi:hypothetical protein
MWYTGDEFSSPRVRVTESGKAEKKLRDLALMKRAPVQSLNVPFG